MAKFADCDDGFRCQDCYGNSARFLNGYARTDKDVLVAIGPKEQRMLRTLGRIAAILARGEGLPAHAASAEHRLRG